MVRREKDIGAEVNSKKEEPEREGEKKSAAKI
jgi:hypothetical protein